MNIYYGPVCYNEEIINQTIAPIKNLNFWIELIDILFFNYQIAFVQSLEHENKKNEVNRR